MTTPNGIAEQYCQMPANAKLRDVVLLARSDAAHHRDINHGFADKLAALARNVTEAAPYLAQ